MDALKAIGLSVLLISTPQMSQPSIARYRLVGSR